MKTLNCAGNPNFEFSLGRQIMLKGAFGPKHVAAPSARTGFFHHRLELGDSASSGYLSQFLKYSAVDLREACAHIKASR